MTHYLINGSDISKAQFSASAHPRPGTYGAAQKSSLRPAPKAVLKVEDDHLPQKDRDKLQSTTNDEIRNFSIGGWALRKHLDFVASHNFDCGSPDKTLNQDIEGHIAEWSEPENFDIRNRCDLHQWVRMAEATATTGGDMLGQKLKSGHVQAIEPDCIRDPEKPDDRWFNGVRQNKAGRNVAYAVWSRKRRGGFEFDRILNERKVYHFGYFSRFAQARGIGLFTPGLDQLKQVSNAVRYAQAKQVLATMLGVVHKVHEPTGQKINLSGGPFVASIGVDESVELVNDKTPSIEFDNFLKHVIGMGLKAVDLPFNFYDEGYTNFFGSRAAINLYLMSCIPKRRRVRAMLNHFTKWQLNYRMSIGKLRLPRSIDLDTLVRKYCSWIPIGFPWWNPLQEAKAAELMLKLRLKSRSELRRETDGDSWFGIQDQIDAEEERLKDSLVATHDTTQSPIAELSDQLTDMSDQLEQIKAMK